MAAAAAALFTGSEFVKSAKLQNIILEIFRTPILAFRNASITLSLMLLFYVRDNNLPILFVLRNLRSAPKLFDCWNGALCKNTTPVQKYHYDQR